MRIEKIKDKLEILDVEGQGKACDEDCNESMWVANSGSYQPGCQIVTKPGCQITCYL